MPGPGVAPTPNEHQRIRREAPLLEDAIGHTRHHDEGPPVRVPARQASPHKRPRVRAGQPHWRPTMLVRVLARASCKAGSTSPAWQGQCRFTRDPSHSPNPWLSESQDWMGFSDRPDAFAPTYMGGSGGGRKVPVTLAGTFGGSIGAPSAGGSLLGQPPSGLVGRHASTSIPASDSSFDRRGRWGTHRVVLWESSGPPPHSCSPGCIPRPV